MKIKLILSIVLIFCAVISMAQIEFPVYKALPPVQRLPQPKIQTWQPSRTETNYEQTSQQSDRTVIANFIIQTATVNGKDLSQHYVKNEACLVIYTEKGSNQIYFANYLPVSKSVSTGAMIEPELSNKPETESSYQLQTSKFKWYYTNSYDNGKGLANVQLVKIYKEGGTSFSCTISSKDTFIKFTGYMQNPN